MRAMLNDRLFIWAIVFIVVVGVSLWGYIQYTIIELDAQLAQVG